MMSAGASSNRLAKASRRLKPTLLLLLASAMFAEELPLRVGSSLVLESPADVERVATSAPEIVDAVVINSREVLLNPKLPGACTVVVWQRGGSRLVYHSIVSANLDNVRRALSAAFPGESFAVEGTGEALALVGPASSAAAAENAVKFLAPMAKAVVNNARVTSAPEKQIVLRVKFAELNRTAGQQLGVNLLSTGAANTPGRITTGQFGATSASELKGAIGAPVTGTSSTFRLSEALNIFAFRPDLNLAAMIQALETRGVLQVIAEPNLVTTNGKEASFLVGGEFPIPIVQGGANVGAVTIQFREFGIRLTFLPNATAHGTVKMFVRPEVSSIDAANGLSLGGFTVPSLSTRRMETNIELALGQSFLIAGLLDDRVVESLHRVPGIGDIPILGYLFRSRARTRAKTELVVMVTPEIALPQAAGAPAPVPPMPLPFLQPETRR